MKTVPDGEMSCIGIGDWRLDPGTQRLERGSERSVLNPKEMAVLLHLAESAPDLVSREALLDRSWPGAVVGDHVLDEVVGRLRKALGDSAQNPTYIETLRKRGYRLIAPVRWVTEEMAVAPTNTVAVMPFEDLSPTRDLGWLTGRLRDTLLARLSRIEQLRVIRTSHTLDSDGDVRLAGQRLGAAALVCGSIYPARDSLTLAVQLLDARPWTSTRST